MRGKTDSNSKLLTFLKRVKTYRQFSLPKDQIDEDFIDFSNNIHENMSWEVFAKTRNRAGDNILHLLAVSFVLASRLTELKEELSKELIKSMIMEKNNNGETPFHSACRYCNVPLFDFILEYLSIAELQVIAAQVNMDCGYNAFHLLCLSSYDSRVYSFRNCLQDKKLFLGEALNRYQLGYYNIPDNVFLFMARLGRILGKDVEDLIMAVDRFGNNGLMLCCYTCQDLLIESCFALFTDIEKLYQAAITALPGTQINPVNVVCEFGSSTCVRVLFNNLNRAQDKMLLPKLCVEQDILLCCYQAAVDDNKRNDFEMVLNQIADAYGDRLEEGIIKNSGDWSILIMSLYGDGIFLKKLIDKKHLHFQYELVCYLFFDMLSPMSDVARPASSRFFLPAIKKSPENRPALIKSLLGKILKIDWHDEILDLMAKTVVNKIPYIQIILRGCGVALLSLIIELEAHREAIPLALFYKVSDHLNPLEQQYVDMFQDNAEMMICLSTFYCQLKSQPETQALARIFLERLLDSRSLLKVSVLQKLSLSDYDKKIREKFADVKKIRNQHINALDQYFSEPRVIAEINVAH